jgi:hypothetical protein
MVGDQKKWAVIGAGYVQPGCVSHQILLPASIGNVTICATD